MVNIAFVRAGAVLKVLLSLSVGFIYLKNHSYSGVKMPVKTTKFRGGESDRNLKEELADFRMPTALKGILLIPAAVVCFQVGIIGWGGLAKLEDYREKVVMYSVFRREGLYPEYNKEDKTVYVWNDRKEGDCVGAVIDEELPRFGVRYIRMKENKKAEDIAKRKGVEIKTTLYDPITHRGYLNRIGPIPHIRK
jgi:hypothetical protein